MKQAFILSRNEIHMACIVSYFRLWAMGSNALLNQYVINIINSILTSDV